MKRSLECLGYAAVAVALMYLYAAKDTPLRLRRADAADAAAFPMRVAKDIPYKTGSPLNRLDVYAPPADVNHPVLVWVHGGGWTRGDKAQVGAKPERFTREGYVFVSVNYRLSPTVTHPAHVQDIAAAVAWVHGNIKNHGGDPNRIFLAGHSAGAHLVALAATDERYLKEVGVSLTVIKGCIPLDGGAYNLSGQADETDMRSAMLQNAFGNDPVVWKAASPVLHVSAGKGIPPFLLIHAGNRALSQAQAAELADALTKAGIAAERRHAPDKNHASLNQELGIPGDAPTQWMLDFMNRIR